MIRTACLTLSGVVAAGTLSVAALQGPVSTAPEVAVGVTTTEVSASALNAMKPGDTISEARFYAVAGEPERERVPSLRVQHAGMQGDRVTVPALGAALPLVTAPVRNGAVAVPKGLRAAGWATYSVPPGAHGVTVLVHHRDGGVGRRTVKSRFDHMGALRRGQVIKVRWKGRVIEYAVTRIETTPTKTLPTSLLRKDGKPTLAVVTCGGPFVIKPNGHLGWAGHRIVWAEARTPNNHTKELS